MLLEQAGEFILNKIAKELPGNYYYHNADHTRDVHDATKSIALAEGIDGEELTLLLTAAFYHDSGYLRTLTEHEAESCRIARTYLPDFGYSPEQIEKICGMIRATRIPQTPHNKLDEILADADLDYLGRDDFFEIGDKYYHECGLTDRNAWNAIQVKFLEEHHYFTQTALNLRNAKKQENLAKVKALIP